MLRSGSKSKALYTSEYKLLVFILLAQVLKGSLETVVKGQWLRTYVFLPTPHPPVPTPSSSEVPQSSSFTLPVWSYRVGCLGCYLLRFCDSPPVHQAGNSSLLFPSRSPFILHADSALSRFPACKTESSQPLLQPHPEPRHGL